MNSCECGNHIWKPASKGFVVLVSPEDEALIDHGVYAEQQGRNWYARSWAWGKKRLQELILLGAGRRDHINRNGMDNRRENLQWATAQENALNSRDRSDHRNVYFDKRRGTYYKQTGPREHRITIQLGDHP